MNTKAGITGIERIGNWSDHQILERVARGHLRILMQDLPRVQDMQAEGLVRAGQEMEGCLGVHMGDHSHIISGTPTANAWVLITPKGTEMLKQLLTAGVSRASFASTLRALDHDNPPPVVDGAL